MGSLSARPQAVVPALGQLIHHTEEDVCRDACWALSYVTDGQTPDHIESVVTSPGVCARLVELVSHHNGKVTRAGLPHSEPYSQAPSGLLP
eukprot:5949818-Pyramimonas_sp.AAC.2